MDDAGILLVMCGVVLGVLGVGGWCLEGRVRPRRGLGFERRAWGRGVAGRSSLVAGKSGVGPVRVVKPVKAKRMVRVFRLPAVYRDAPVWVPRAVQEEIAVRVGLPEGVGLGVVQLSGSTCDLVGVRRERRRVVVQELVQSGVCAGLACAGKKVRQVVNGYRRIRLGRMSAGYAAGMRAYLGLLRGDN